MNKSHSHDTATPALSVESEEAVAAALWQEEAREGTPKSIWQARTLDAFRDTADSNQDRWRRFARAALAAAPAPNPSPAAKGGEAEVRIARIEAQMLQHGGVDSDDMEWMARMVRSHLATPTAEQAWDILQTAALSTPTEEPAWQTEGMGGDAGQAGARAISSLAMTTTSRVSIPGNGPKIFAAPPRDLSQGGQHG